jgi:hypothetical protein
LAKINKVETGHKYNHLFNQWFLDRPFLISLIPSIFFYSFILHFGINAPFADDWSVINGMVIRFFNGPENWMEKFLLLFSQSNEHRLFYTSLVSVIQYGLFGQINYLWLSLIGALSSFGLHIIFYMYLNRYRLAKWLIIPIAIIIYNLTYFQNLFWPVSALQHNSIIFLVFLAVFILDAPQKKWSYFLVGSFLVSIAVFSSANGFVILIAGIPIIAIYPKKYWFLWFFLSLFLFILYTINYIHPVQRANILDNLFLADRILISFFVYWGAFLGTFFSGPSILSIASSCIIGVFIFSFITYWFYTKWSMILEKNNDIKFLASIYLFLICTITIYSVARANNDIYLIFESRYGINFVLILILTVIIVSRIIKNELNSMKLFFIGFTILFSGFSFYNQVFNLIDFTNMLVAGSIKSNIHKREFYFYRDSIQRKVDLSKPTLNAMADLSKPIVNITTKLPASIKYLNDVIKLTFDHKIYQLDKSLKVVSSEMQVPRYHVTNGSNQFKLGEFEFDINSAHFSYTGLKVKGRILNGADGYYLVFENGQHQNWVFNMYWREIDRRKQLTHWDGIYLRNLSGAVPFIYLPDDRYVAKIFKIEDGVASLVGVTPNFKVNGM